MKHTVLAVIVGWALCLAPMMSAQAAAGSPKTGTEHGKLAWFVGKWAAEADFKPSAASSGGKSNWTETCEWFEGNFALNCHSEGEFGGHPVKEISVMAYDETAKTYVYFETNSSDESDLWRGKVEGNTWTWDKKSFSHGKPAQMRFTQRFSGDSMDFKLEAAVGDAPFKVVMDGKQLRQK
jgi:uncharacterized protein DUF1579